jgi:GNAT superfamily N-acetyltransferase
MSAGDLPRGFRYSTRVRPSPPSLVVRRATRRDIPVLLRHRRAMLLEISDSTETAVDRYLRAFRRWMTPRLQTGELRGFVAEDSPGRALGSGCLWLAREYPRLGNPTGKTPYALSVFVEPGHRRQGVATRLLRVLVREGRRIGAERIRLHSSVQGRRLYQSLGFERTWEMRLLLHPSRSAPRKRRRPGSRGE